MDVQLSAGQGAAVYNAQRLASVGVYTNIPGNAPHHYSWQRTPAGVDQIVVGVGGGGHRNFTCNITAAFVVNLVQGGGALAVGAGGINLAALTTSVENALKLRFRNLITTNAFNDLGRTPQQVTFQNNRVVNRHAARRLFVSGQMITGGQNRNFAAGTMRGFAVYQFLAGNDTYYRNYDIRENLNANNREDLRVIHGNPVTLNGTFSGNINIVLL